MPLLLASSEFPERGEELVDPIRRGRLLVEVELALAFVPRSRGGGLGGLSLLPPGAILHPAQELLLDLGQDLAQSAKISPSRPRSRP
ncbi:hypothetical protein, partial [Methylorubrum thiocyanatum]|uniref:hypothetical protein n=1 Tax=Methylorubrum thiocyanatum TaxID=47958 RepID=UPI0035C86CDB